MYVRRSSMAINLSGLQATVVWSSFSGDGRAGPSSRAWRLERVHLHSHRADAYLETPEGSSSIQERRISDWSLGFLRCLWGVTVDGHVVDRLTGGLLNYRARVIATSLIPWLEQG